MLQSVLGKRANGVPQLSVLMLVAPLETSPGTLPAILDQNQTLIKEEVLSTAYLSNEASAGQSV